MQTRNQTNRNLNDDMDMDREDMEDMPEMDEDIGRKGGTATSDMDDTDLGYLDDEDTDMGYQDDLDAL